MCTNNNFTVEKLVKKYSEYVKVNCPKSACLGTWQDEEGKSHQGLVHTPIPPFCNAYEQLLITLYKDTFGENVDESIVHILSKYANAFMRSALTKDEYSFLLSNFTDVVKYEFSNRGNFSHLQSLEKDKNSIVKEYLKPAEGSIIFIANTGYCDLAVQFANCTVKGFTGYSSFASNENEVWALGQIRMIASGIKTEIVATQEENDRLTCTLPPKGSVDYIIYGLDSDFMGANDVVNEEEILDLLKPNGKMLFFADSKYHMAGKGRNNLICDRIVNDKLLSSIIQYEYDDRFLSHRKKNILLVIEKKDNKEVNVVDKCKELSITVRAEDIRADILWPSYYMTSRLREGINLSSLVSIEEGEDIAILSKKTGSFILPDESKNIFVVQPSDLGNEYKNANILIKELPCASNAMFEEEIGFIENVKKPCILLSGSADNYLVGYIACDTERKYAKLGSISYLTPQKGIDVRYVAALLFSPEVKRQIVGICDGDYNTSTLSCILDKIIVPSHDERERLVYLLEANYEAMCSSNIEKKLNKENYVKAIRMRKHSLTQSLSAMEATFYALNTYRIRKNGYLSDCDKLSRLRETTVRDAFEKIAADFHNIMPMMEHLADVEYSFAKQEWINPEQFIEDYINKNAKRWLNFTPIITWDKEHNIAKKDIIDPSSKRCTLHKGESISSLYFPKDALEKILNNIVSNAISHGFRDKKWEKNKLRFSWYTDGISIMIEIENNGLPIHRDIDASSLLEYGVSTALNHDGHSGIGCNEIKDIMQRYNGDIKIIPLTTGEYTVKYILTFNSTIIRIL